MITSYKNIGNKSVFGKLDLVRNKCTAQNLPKNDFFFLQFMSAHVLIIGKGYFLEKILKFIHFSKRYFNESLVNDIRY